MHRPTRLALPIIDLLAASSYGCEMPDLKNNFLNWLDSSIKLVLEEVSHDSYTSLFDEKGVSPFPGYHDCDASRKLIKSLCVDIDPDSLTRDKLQNTTNIILNSLTPQDLSEREDKNLVELVTHIVFNQLSFFDNYAAKLKLHLFHDKVAALKSKFLEMNQCLDMKQVSEFAKETWEKNFQWALESFDNSAAISELEEQETQTIISDLQDYHLKGQVGKLNNICNMLFVNYDLNDLQKTKISDVLLDYIIDEGRTEEEKEFLVGLVEIFSTLMTSSKNKEHLPVIKEDVKSALAILPEGDFRKELESLFKFV